MNMIERVARALCAQAGYGTVDKDWSVYYGSALAAIKAMRELTDTMLDAGNHERIDGQNVTEVYEAMIDAALNERKP